MYEKKERLQEEITARFWQADDIISEIDDIYLQRLHARLGEMVWYLYGRLPAVLRPESIHTFIAEEIAGLYQSLSREHILEKYRDNSGNRRHGEDAYFLWLRQRVLIKLFLPAITYILQTPVTAFHRNDYQIFATKDFMPEKHILVDVLDGEPLQLEIIFDTDSSRLISPEQITAAKEFYRQTGYATLLLHIDLRQGVGALLLLDKLKEKKCSIVIPDSSFIWKISEIPPIFPEEITALPYLMQKNEDKRNGEKCNFLLPIRGNRL